MRLTFIIYATGTFGGGRYSIYKFAEYLAKRGNYITVFLIGKSLFTNEEKDENLQIIKCSQINLKLKGVGVVNKIIKKLFFFPRLNIFLKNNKQDFIVGYQVISALDAIYFGNKHNIKVANFVFETPDWLMLEHKNWIQNHIKKKNLRIWNSFKKTLLKSDQVFPNSKLTKNKAEKWLNKTINNPIYPGIDIKKIPDNDNIKQQNQIIYIGKLEAHKNIHILLEALAQLKNPPFLIVCGNGPELNKLKEIAKIKGVSCKFKGNISDTEKWILLKQSMFLVFPSSFEGFGMPPMEALASGIPCLCSDIPIIKSVYDNHVEYFKSENSQDLAEKISFLYYNEDYRKNRGKDGKKFILENYTWDHSASKLESLLLNKQYKE